MGLPNNTLRAVRGDENAWLQGSGRSADDSWSMAWQAPASGALAAKNRYRQVDPPRWLTLHDDALRLHTTEP
jgi:tRNA-specific 2-thiouridylase